MTRLLSLVVLVALACAAQTGLRSPAFVAGLAPRGGSAASFLTDLVAYYALEDAADAHTSGFDLTEYAMPTYAGGKNNNALDCAGGGYLKDDGAAFDFNAKSYTVSFWFNSPGVATDQGLFSWDSSGGTSLRLSSSAVVWYHYDGGWQSCSSAVGLSDNTWTHVVMRYDAATDTMSLWVNGTKATDTTSVGDLAASGAHLFIGRESWGNQSNALIDECAMWYRALSDTEVGNLYNSGTGLFYGSF